jgi:hypothetical protein
MSLGRRLAGLTRGWEMSELNREAQLQGIRRQLEHWQDNIAARVANEARALALEIGKLGDHEFDEVWDLLRAANDQVLAATDILRDLRRRLQDRHRAT